MGATDGKKHLRGPSAVQAETKPAPSTHAIQFYEHDEAMMERFAEFAGSALGSGRSCLVVLTAEHERELTHRLLAWGLDVKGMVDSGRLILLDAVESLSLFMVNDYPNSEFFAASVGGLMAQMGAASMARGKRPAIFGEMPTMLWAEGKMDAAIRLEQLWNEMALKHSFSLLCAYPLRSFGRAEHEEGFRQLCDVHSHVGACESDEIGSERSGKMLAVSDLRRRARMLEAAGARAG